MCVRTRRRAWHRNKGKDSVTLSSIKGLGLGDPGANPKTPRALPATSDASPFSIFALLELHRAGAGNDYLALADRVAANLLARTFHHGFLLADAHHLHANFDALEPLALLALAAARQGRPELVPTYSGGGGCIYGHFGDLGRTYDHQAIWSIRRPGIL